MMLLGDYAALSAPFPDQLSTDSLRRRGLRPISTAPIPRWYHQERLSITSSRTTTGTRLPTNCVGVGWEPFNPGENVFCVICSKQRDFTLSVTHSNQGDFTVC